VLQVSLHSSDGALKDSGTWTTDAQGAWHRSCEGSSNNIASFIRPGAPGIEGIQFRVINIAANGPVVMTERVDIFKLPDKSFELPVMGTFEVSDGKISAWRDYFDMNQFTSRMG
jgi:limonene-1,2-epoxide hydrolase